MFLPGELLHSILDSDLEIQFSGSVPHSKSDSPPSVQMVLLPCQTHQVRNIQISKPFRFSSSPRYVRERSKSWKTLVKTEDEKKQQMEEYKVLLQKLVKTKLHSESETSKMDSFKDLRVDIRNELSELKSMMAGCKNCSTNLKAKDSPKVWDSDHPLKFGNP